MQRNDSVHDINNNKFFTKLHTIVIKATDSITIFCLDKLSPSGVFEAQIPQNDTGIIATVLYFDGVSYHQV
jgi:hypothetical protein